MKDAAEATARAAEFEGRVVEAGKLDGLALEAQVKLLTVELGGLSISAARKMTLRDTLGSYGKRVVAWKKKNAAEQTTRVVDQVVEAAASSSGKKVKDKALMLVSADESSDRYMVVAFAPKGMKGVDCKAWAAAATEGTGAKGGGKKDST